MSTPGDGANGPGYPLAFGEPIPLSPEERSRRLLSFWLMGILTLVIAFIGWFVVARGSENAAEVVTVFLTPVIGLVGSVIGFYFGGGGKP